ncbi:3-hydroxy-3-methylglutaryl-CoA reductase [Candidatus Woesearchaeota archaeon]|nr:3-hydroxy-3-methylglutaryl-CoA reductase [Candidatus Woesearchaeota archaeon]
MDKNIRGQTESTAIPTYLIGPVSIRGKYATGEIMVPLSVTETPLVPSVNRGAKAARLSGGIETTILKDEMTRAPYITAEDEKSAEQIARHITEHKDAIAEAANATTRYGQFKSIETIVHGREIYARIGMSCGDAAGHNMTTQAAAAVVEYIIRTFPGQARPGSLSSNLCPDKKPSEITVRKGRGKSVEAYATIPERILREVLKTSGERLAELNQKKNITGSELAGSLSRNAHHANIVAAIYLATGQDIANVVEGSLGTTSVEFRGEDTVFSVYLPSVIVGTVGGGTSQPYAQKNLELLGCRGTGNPVGSNAKRLAEIVAATVLAGELSLMAALANNGELMKTHILYER